MKISFDPFNAEESALVTSIIDHAISEPVVRTPTAPETTEPPEPVIDTQAGVELDVNGTPHIPEVHAGTKTKTTGGIWKGKRGIDKEVIAVAEQAARDKIAGTPTPALAPTGMPMPSEMPQAVITMDEVLGLWNELVERNILTEGDVGTMYKSSGVDPAQLAANETMRRSLYDYMNALKQNAE